MSFPANGGQCVASQAKDEQIRRYRQQADNYGDRVVAADALRQAAQQEAQHARASQQTAEEQSKRLQAAMDAAAADLSSLQRCGTERVVLANDKCCCKLS